MRARELGRFDPMSVVNGRTMKLGDLAGSMGRGLVAGAVGTAAITASQMVEMRITGRQPSTAASDAAGKVLGVKPESREHQQRFGTIVHWLYGTAWGAVPGLLVGLGSSGRRTAMGTWAAIWGTEQAMLPALIDSPPLSEQEPKTVAIDVAHHAVYAVVTTAVLAMLNRWSSGGSRR
jgi:hypothetical protein